MIAYWKRRLGLRAVAGLATVLLAVALVGINSDRGWEFGALAAFAAFLVVGLSARIAAHMHMSLKSLGQLNPPEIRLELSDQDFTIESNLGRSSLRWPGVSEVWRFERAWLLFLLRQQFATLPLNGLPPDAQAFIVDRVRAAGGRVR